MLVTWVSAPAGKAQDAGDCKAPKRWYAHKCRYGSEIRALTKARRARLAARRQGTKTAAAGTTTTLVVVDQSRVLLAWSEAKRARAGLVALKDKLQAELDKKRSHDTAGPKGSLQDRYHRAQERLADKEAEELMRLEVPFDRAVDADLSSLGLSGALRASKDDLLYLAPGLDRTDAVLARLEGRSIPGGSVLGVRRLAIVDMQRVLRDSKMGRAAAAELKRAFHTYQRELNAKQEELRAMRGKVMQSSDAALRKRYDGELAALQARFQGLQGKLAKLEADKVAPIIVRMRTVAAKLAGQGKLDAIVSHRSWLYVAPSVDVTSTLTRMVDNTPGVIRQRPALKLAQVRFDVLVEATRAWKAGVGRLRPDDHTARAALRERAAVQVLAALRKVAAQQGYGLVGSDAMFNDVNVLPDITRLVSSQL